MQRRVVGAIFLAALASASFQSSGQVIGEDACRPLKSAPPDFKRCQSELNRILAMEISLRRSPDPDGAKRLDESVGRLRATIPGTAEYNQARARATAVVLKEKCGDDYDNVRVGMSWARATECTAVKFRRRAEQLLPDNSVLTTYQSPKGSVVHVIGDKIVRVDLN
jgi:hypothetical protein